MDVFRMAWRSFARIGRCGSVGGLQFRRAVADYRRAGRPAAVATWVLAWARADYRRRPDAYDVANQAASNKDKKRPE